jgi:putative transposase
MEHNSKTYSKIYLQLVFAVRHRQALIHTSWEEEVYKYITGVIQNKDQLLIAINGNRDHIHILISIRPTCVISDLVREVKKASTNFINSKKFIRGSFSWQEGYGVFSYSHWNVDQVKNYVLNQKEHHRKKTFKEEYMELLKEFDVDFKEEYCFEWIDDDHLVESLS